MLGPNARQVIEAVRGQGIFSTLTKTDLNSGGINMKKLLVAGFAAAAFCGAPAFAADLPTKGPVYKGAAVAPMFNWSGFYVGAHVGGGWSDLDWTLVQPAAPAGEPLHHSDTGFLVGGHVGLQKQFGNLVVGIEGSYTGGSPLDDRVESTLFPGLARVASIKDLYMATARLGLAQDRWLGYVKGGYANGPVELKTLDAANVVTSQTSHREGGWVLGAGLEYALTNLWIFGLEYNFIHLNIGDRVQLAAAAATVTNADAHVQTLMARLSFKFGDPWGKAPVSARY